MEKAKAMEEMTADEVLLANMGMLRDSLKPMKRTTSFPFVRVP